MISPSAILDDTVQYLNSLTLSSPYTASKNYKPVDSLVDMGATTYVRVTSGGMSRSRQDRDNKRITTRIKLTVTKKVDAAVLDIAPLLTLCEEIAESFSDKDFFVFRVLDLPIIDPVYDTDKFYKTAIFHSVIIVEGSAEADRFNLADDELRCLTDPDGFVLCL